MDSTTELAIVESGLIMVVPTSDVTPSVAAATGSWDNANPDEVLTAGWVASA